MTDRELMQMALDALESVFEGDDKGAEYWTVTGGTYEAVECMNAMRALRARLAQPEPEPEKSQDKPCVEDDGCPTEKAVLQRFWREHQAQPEPEELGEIIPADEEQLKRIAKLVEPKPVAWWHDRGDVVDLNVSGHGTPLYFAPPQREWQGLTDDERKQIEIKAADKSEMTAWEYAHRVGIFTEAKLKEKNT